MKYKLILNIFNEGADIIDPLKLKILISQFVILNRYDVMNESW